MNIFITRPQKEDTDTLHKLFIAVITDNYREDGLGDDTAGIQHEFEKKMVLLKQDFSSNGLEQFFLIARVEEKIVGTIAYGTPSDVMKKNLTIDSQNIPEIKAMYILPEWQGKGIGTLLFNAILVILLHKGVQEVCLNGGYKKSQNFWIKRFGDPTVTLKDYWGKDHDEILWLCKLKDLPIMYKTT